MRILRVLAMATGCAALLSQSSAAQDGRHFKDAWFWGVKGGAMSFNSAITTNGGAPIVGADWLITRTHGGLYMSFDQAFFTTEGGFVDRDVDSVFIRPVALKNMRRFTMAGMAFPLESRTLHPYVGLGLSLNQVAAASLLTGPTNGQRYQIALDSIQSRKAAFSPIMIAGVQAQRTRLSLFAQGTASPTQRAFFLSNDGGSAFNFSFELGARYNVGTSIDRGR